MPAKSESALSDRAPRQGSGPKVTDLNRLVENGARILDTLYFDMLEAVWLIGPHSYLVVPSAAIDFSTESWRAQWHVSQKRHVITGVSTSYGRLYYQFHGGGCCDGSRMFRDHTEAVAAVRQHNEGVFGLIHFSHRMDVTPCGLVSSDTRITTAYQWNSVNCPSCLEKKPK